MPVPLPIALAYNPSSSRWDVLPAMTTGRIGAPGMEMQSCGLLVLGGGVGPNGKAVATYEMLVR